MKKIICIFTVFVMVLSLFTISSVNIYAEEPSAENVVEIIRDGSSFGQYADNTDNVWMKLLQDGDTVKLLKDRSTILNFAVFGAKTLKTVTLDLNGHSITNTKGNAIYLNHISSTYCQISDFTLINSGDKTTGKLVGSNFGIGIMNDVTIHIKDDVIIESGSQNIGFVGTGTGTIILDSAKEYSVIGKFSMVNASGARVYGNTLNSFEGFPSNNFIRLEADYDYILAIYSPYKVDLNGYTIKGIHVGLNDTVEGSLVLMDSVGTGKVTDGDDPVGTAILLGKNSELTVESGTIEGTTYAIAGNGRYGGTKITINGGTIKGIGTDGVGIYNPQNGSLAINGGTIEGKTAVQMCGGTLTVKGGTFNATGTDLRTSKGTGDGSIIDGAAISVVNRTGYPSVPTVTLNGGTYKSSAGHSVLAYKWATGTHSTWDNATVTINGGTYSSDVTAYAASGLKAFEKDGNFVIGKYTQSIKIPTTLNIEKGETASVAATVTPSDTTEAVTYTSSDTTVATVDSKGLVTTKAVGTTTITVTSGDQTATCIVTVYELPEEVVNIPTTTTTPEVVVNEETKTVVKDTVKEIIENDNSNAVSGDTKKALLQAIQEKKSITVVPEVTKLTDVDQAVITKIEAQLGTTGEVAQYFDISLMLKADDTNLGKINELTGKASFTVEIDESLIQDGRTFYMIAVHEDGSVEMIQGTLNGNKFTFETNKFSTYGLGYKQAPKINVDNGTTASPVKTDDEAPIMLYSVLAFLALAGGYQVFKRKEQF